MHFKPSCNHSGHCCRNWQYKLFSGSAAMDKTPQRNNHQQVLGGQLLSFLSWLARVTVKGYFSLTSPECTATGNALTATGRHLSPHEHSKSLSIAHQNQLMTKA